MLSCNSSPTSRDPDDEEPQLLRNAASISGLLLRDSLALIDFVSLNENENETAIPFPSLSFIDDAKYMRIEHSCNGLFCCETKHTYYIYNPYTKQHTKLPTHGMFVVAISLAFDPWKSPHYKAVCVRESIESSRSCQIEIYSSETGSFRPSGGPVFLSYNLDFHNAVYWNGAIHWVDKWGTSLYFDIEREILLTMPMPPIPEGRNKREIRYFGESRGHMHLIEIYDPSLTQFDVLEMESNHSNWFVKYRVDLDALTTAYPEMVQDDFDHLHLHRYAFSILCLVRGEKEEETSSLLLNIPGKVISYNLEDETFKKIHNLQGGHYKWFTSYQYFETLSC